MDKERLSKVSSSVLSLWAVVSMSLPDSVFTLAEAGQEPFSGLRGSLDIKKRVNQDHGITHFYEMGEEKILNLGYSDCYSNCHTDKMTVIPPSHTDYTNCHSDCHTDCHTDCHNDCYTAYSDISPYHNHHGGPHVEIAGIPYPDSGPHCNVCSAHHEDCCCFSCHGESNPCHIDATGPWGICHANCPSVTCHDASIDFDLFAHLWKYPYECR